jgi:hypothetical protein
MPITVHTRPDLPYDAVSKHNDNRYGLLASRDKPPTAQMLDADFDYVIDSLDNLSKNIEDAVAGNIPGYDEDANNRKFLTTDGNSLGWDFVRSVNIFNDLTGIKFLDDSINGIKLEDGTVKLDKLSIDDGTFPGAKVTADSIVLGQLNIPDGTFPGAKVTADSIVLGQLNIPDGTFPGAKVTADSIVLGQLNIPDGTFPGAKVTDTSVSSDKLISVDGVKLVDTSVASSKLISVNGAKLENATVTKQKFENPRLFPYAFGSVSGGSQQNGVQLFPGCFNLNRAEYENTTIIRFYFNEIAPNNEYIVLASYMGPGPGSVGYRARFTDFFTLNVPGNNPQNISFVVYSS